MSQKLDNEYKKLEFVKKWTKFQTRAQKCSKVHFIRKICCSNRETGRFDEKLGDSRENRESWRVCRLVEDGDHRCDLIWASPVT